MAKIYCEDCESFQLEWTCLAEKTIEDTPQRPTPKYKRVDDPGRNKSNQCPLFKQGPPKDKHVKRKKDGVTPK